MAQLGGLALSSCWGPVGGRRLRCESMRDISRAHTGLGVGDTGHRMDRGVLILSFHPVLFIPLPVLWERSRHRWQPWREVVACATVPMDDDRE